MHFSCEQLIWLERYYRFYLMNATWYDINSHLTITLTACSEYLTEDQHPPFQSLTQQKQVSHSHTAIQPSTSRSQSRAGCTGLGREVLPAQLGTGALSEGLESCGKLWNVPLLDRRDTLSMYLLWGREWGQVLMCQMEGSWGHCATAYGTKRGWRWKWRSWSRKIKGALDAKPLEKQLLSFFLFWIIQSEPGLSCLSLFLPHTQNICFQGPAVVDIWKYHTAVEHFIFMPLLKAKLYLKVPRTYHHFPIAKAQVFDEGRVSQPACSPFLSPAKSCLTHQSLSYKSG